MKHTLASLALLVVVTGCGFDEGLTIKNMEGRVVVPREAATRTIVTSQGEQEITDVRLIGPVYLGLFSSVESGVLDYPHPEMGPIFKPGVPGDTYPYGGTTVGDVRYACLEFFTCKVISGRYVDFDDMTSWFNDTLEEQITDEFGDVTNGEYIRQRCYDRLNLTTDEEIQLTATKDRNADGQLDKMDLDFVENADGDFEANFTLWQQEYFAGFSLWGWMDSPSDASYQFSTCDPTQGFAENEYTADYFGGLQQPDLLNTPSNYIATGDWVASEGFVYQSADDAAVLMLDFPVGE